jgi:hypothetical protein
VPNWIGTEIRHNRAAIALCTVPWVGRRFNHAKKHERAKGGWLPRPFVEQKNEATSVVVGTRVMQAGFQGSYAAVPGTRSNQGCRLGGAGSARAVRNTAPIVAAMPRSSVRNALRVREKYSQNQRSGALIKQRSLKNRHSELVKACSPAL